MVKEGGKASKDSTMIENELLLEQTKKPSTGGIKQRHRGSDRVVPHGGKCPCEWRREERGRNPVKKNEDDGSKKPGNSKKEAAHPHGTKGVQKVRPGEKEKERNAARAFE